MDNLMLALIFYIAGAVIRTAYGFLEIVTFEDDEYICKTAENVKEAKELIEAGYQYVCDMDNLKLFRKRK